MISTVTTSTVAMITNMTLVGTFGLIGSLVLFALLLQKEAISAFHGKRIRRLRLALNVAIAPLLVVFGFLVATKIFEQFP